MFERDVAGGRLRRRIAGQKDDPVTRFTAQHFRNTVLGNEGFGLLLGFLDV